MTVTLDTLLADFETARRSYELCFDGIPFPYTPDNCASFRGEYIPSSSVEMLNMVKAALLYVLARDYGLDAAMLWKLSGGAIDSRVKA